MKTQKIALIGGPGTGKTTLINALKTKGYKDVKIVALLESESNKEDSKSKRSLADLIVEDEDHHKYIIEIERNVKDSFIHKSLFNTSRLIVDNLAQREDYTQIIKIFQILQLVLTILQELGFLIGSI